MKQKPIFKEIFIDDSGLNKILMRVTEKTKTLSLKLKSETKKRRIGVITISTKTLKIKRNRLQHLLYKANAYGFNEFILKNQTSFDTISLSDEQEHWKFPVELVLTAGQTLWFKDQGYEKQLFLTLQQLQPYKVEAKHRL